MDFFIGADFLDLKQTLFCGQCFRFAETDDNIFEGMAGGRYVKLRQEKNGITLLDAEEDDVRFWQDYFDTELDYGGLIKAFSEDKTLEAACRGRGIRVLKQEPFETLISFIISQNNNIKRITGIIQRLCENFGDRVRGGYSFPSAEKLAALSPDDLSPLRAGFRAKYIIDAAQKVNSGEVDFAKIALLPDDEAREALKVIKGVGDKVADCVLLFGLHRLSAVPKDVWIKRVISYYYPDGLPACVGEYAGIAQQYLFDFARTDMKKELTAKE